MIEVMDVPSAPERAPRDESFVGGKIARGGSWTVGARLVSRLIDLVTMLVLAHMLTPKDFGLVAIAMTVIYIIEAALELPVSQALVRISVIETAQYDTAFTLSLLRGAALSILVCLVSWPLARFYSDPRILPLVCVLSLAPAGRGMVSPKLAAFTKRLDFSPDFTMEIVGKLAAFTVAITLAVIARSYWALAAGTVIAPIAASLTSYVLAPYRPRLSLSALASFSGFLGWITAAQVVSAFNWQTDRLLLGKLTSKSELGLFTAANDTANIPVMALFGPILRPLLSAFSLLKDDPKRLATSYQRSATAMVTLGLPILVGESLIAYPAVRLLFGEKWLGSAPLLRWLAISLIPMLFAMPMGPLVMALGKTHIFLKRNLFEVCVKLPLVAIGAIKFGFMGVVFARCISEVATIAYCMLVVCHLIGVPVRDQIIGPWRSFAGAAAMAVVVSSALPQLTRNTTTIPLAAGTLLAVTLGAATYGGVLWTLWIAADKPAGVEALVTTKLTNLMKRNAHIAASGIS